MSLRRKIRELEFPMYHVARYDLYRSGNKVETGRFTAPGYLIEDAERHAERVMDEKIRRINAHVAVYTVKKPNVVDRVRRVLDGALNS